VTRYFLPPALYHEGSFERQKSDVTPATLEAAAIRSASCVLDVGCGAGQTLRLVAGLAHAAHLVGLDPDAEALAAGRSLGGGIAFVRGEGERLPLADGAASHVICRVALNYMHQARTLDEIGRVLAPGGRLIVSFIAVGYNLREVVRPGRLGLRQRLGSGKDLLAGLILQATGFQADRGTRLGRSVPHTSPRWLGRRLRGLNMEVASLTSESSFLGLPTVQWAIALKKL